MSKQKPAAIALGTALAGLTLTGAAFAMEPLAQGYMLAAGETAKAQEARYNAVLMDLQMPNGNGLDATRALRRLDGFGEVPIIALTANAFSEDRAACLSTGMCDFLTKPYPPDELYRVLARWL